MSVRFKISHEDDEPEFVEVTDKRTKLENTQQPVKKLVFSLYKLRKKRQRTETLGRKIQWALYQKDDFDSLIKDMSGLVEKLPETFPIFVKVLEGPDELLNRGVVEEVRVNGHKLEGAVIPKGENKNSVGDDLENNPDTLAAGP
ncbi:hypothetical protein GLAREA_12958 [Glarea lozoyensis ATCC 20868]|uniref:Prion-inhibition and propagation HeLo domain-containing protein n=1 Tax=Glarea lozoyensis (strain ATCC 20868 / MF5171) TaxID=1116229 RepID=S3CX98_GLAL2|nr:uncharacterized protein GLAREA_12958 [Glarea lozoyensis ATCC 20868]EPE30235.1 hypothetical protein GLAREA_12958 [Glarea lozoyensis ATCC 20868]